MLECEFPGCSFESEEKSLFDNHHIKQKSDGGSDLRFNRLFLCPNCHRRIFIEEAKSGIHSIKHLDSITVLQKLRSTVGEVLHFKKCKDGKEYFWYYKLNEESSGS